MPKRKGSGRPRKWRPPVQTHKRPPNHTNAFVDLNGVPYLLAEYLDRTQFRQIDRSLIRSDIFIDDTESMRAVIDVNIDNIGRRADGFPKIQGNNTKQRRLLRMIQRHSRRLNQRLDVLRRGLVLRVNYHLENLRTGQVIRSTSEHLRIRDRQYFIDINPRDINDNGIIVNFMDTLVSTMNQFTHGIDRMRVRVTSIQLFYEQLSRRQDRVSGARRSSWNEDLLPEPGIDFHPWNHHGMFQNHHNFDVGVPCNCDESVNLHPPSWTMFNRFYRFDNRGRDIILHTSEINDPNNRVQLIPCGTVHVNRAFIINPGHRIVFKFSVWKNDVTSFHNTQRVAQALGAQHLDPSWCAPPPRPRPPGGRDDLLIRLLSMLTDKRMTDKMQDKEIRRLRRMIKQLQNGQQPPDDCCPGCNCDPCECCDPPYPPDCDCEGDCTCQDNGECCCDDYPNCDCDCDPGDCQPCCPDYPDCDCEDGPEPPPGCCENCGCDPCECEAITEDELQGIWDRVFG